jgi:putative glycosyltransferase (TIGR04348 family)
MILLVSPAASGSLSGNGVTADRWAAVLRDLGHQVRISQHYPGSGTEPVHALIALHARKSGDAVLRFRADHPGAPVVVALTGTDLYPDLSSTGVRPEVLAAADRFVVLQEHGVAQLDPSLRSRAQVIVQSLPTLPPRPPRPDIFEVAFLTHLRPVKDPLRPALAARLLPPASRVRITHLGAPLDDSLAAQARAEAADNPRYDWLGPLPRERALAVLARSRLLLLTSWYEGGANVVTEALAAGVPVVSSAIAGSIGLLGEDYPGYFPPGDTKALAALLDAVDNDRHGVRSALTARCARLRWLVEPARERQAWAGLLTELALPAVNQH